MEYARVAVSLWGGLAAPKVQTCSSKARTVRSYRALAGAAAVVDVFVYVVVLNLFVEYFPKVISETFTLSLLTAVLLKAVLEVSSSPRTESRLGSGKPRRRLVRQRRQCCSGWCWWGASSLSWKLSTSFSGPG